MNDHPAPKQYQCRHIFTDGHRCASPCLRTQEFCYYHHTTRKPVAAPRQRRSRRSTFHLPLPEDRSAIQASIGEVLQRIAANDIDPRRAGLLLYGLQIASLNLPKAQPATQRATQRGNQTQTAETQTVEEITLDTTFGVLAPRTEVGKTEKPKSSVHLLMERILQKVGEEEKQKQQEEKEPDKKQLKENQTEESPTTPIPATLPTLQATADPTPTTDNGQRTTRRSLRCRHPLKSPLSPPHRTRKPQTCTSESFLLNDRSISSKVLPLVSGKKNAAVMKYSTVQAAQKENIA
jgi:hypothetical protein